MNKKFYLINIDYSWNKSFCFNIILFKMPKLLNFGFEMRQGQLIQYLYVANLLLDKNFSFIFLGVFCVRSVSYNYQWYKPSVAFSWNHLTRTKQRAETHISCLAQWCWYYNTSKYVLKHYLGNGKTHCSLQLQ